MTNWHIQTIWLVTALTALILSIFITCKKDIKLTQTAESDYKDYKFDFKNENKGSNRIDPEDYDHLYRHRRHIGTLKRRIKVNYRPESNKTTEAGITRKYCVNIENTLRGNFSTFLIHQRFHQKQQFSKYIVCQRTHKLQVMPGISLHTISFSSGWRILETAYSGNDAL